MLELHIANNNVSDSSTSIGWCISKELIEQMTIYGMNDPHIVICIAPENYGERKEYRKVVSLRDLIAYVDFRCAGKNKIFAFISDDKKETENKFLYKEYGGYHTSILNSDGSDYSDSLKYYRGEAYLADPIEVEVPKELFAKEPSEWEKDYVNYFFKNKCIDQCDFRRRRIFAYTIQPIILFFSILIRFLLTTFALLIGARNLSLNPLIHPMTYPISDTYDYGGSIFIGRGKNEALNYAKIIFMPIFYVIMFAFYKLHIVRYALMTTFAIIVIVGIAFGIVGIVFGIIKLQKINEIKNRKWYLEEKEMHLLTCFPDKRIIAFSDLPKQKRTFRLFFQDVKSKICKPFSL